MEDGAQNANIDGKHLGNAANKSFENTENLKFGAQVLENELDKLQQK